MLSLSCDAYEGARRAFFILNPTTTDEDWEGWLGKHTSDTIRGFDDFAALSYVCSKALKVHAEIPDDIREFIAYSMGYFEAMEIMIMPQWLGQSVSSFAPKHIPRMHRKQANNESQFED